MSKQSRTSVNLPTVLCAFALALFAWSGVGPYDRVTWALEVAPVAIGVIVLLFTYNRYPLTRLVYWLLFIHACILMIGGHYSYARVPVGYWVQDLFDLQRNPYDRLGHFAQGFIPAMLIREMLLRTSPLKVGKWLFVLVTCSCLAFSAFYELIEWWAALALEQGAEEFLGTQGDQWDTQWDMFMALVGAITAQLFLSNQHQTQLKVLLK